MSGCMSFLGVLEKSYGYSERLVAWLGCFIQKVGDLCS